MTMEVKPKPKTFSIDGVTRDDLFILYRGLIILESVFEPGNNTIYNILLEENAKKLLTTNQLNLPQPPFTKNNNGMGLDYWRNTLKDYFSEE